MPKAPPPYPAEFREQAVRLALSSDKRTAEIAADLGISYETLRKWIKRHEVDGGNAPGVTSSERDELRRLRRENRILKEERDILRKAAADSGGRRNSGFREHSGWRPVPERLAGSGVELARDFVEVALREGVQVGALRQVLPQ